jgi:hypothetical protein
MPTAPDDLKHWAEQAIEEPAIAKKQVKVFFYVRASAPDPRECAIDRAKNDQIDDRNSE